MFFRNWTNKDFVEALSGRDGQYEVGTEYPQEARSTKQLTQTLIGY